MSLQALPMMSRPDEQCLNASSRVLVIDRSMSNIGSTPVNQHIRSNSNTARMAIKKEAVSDYELARQEKIRKNQELLQQLQLDAQQTGIGPKKPKPAASAGQKRKRPAAQRVKKEEQEPRRTSARLQGIVADSEVARDKEEKEAVKFQEEQRIKRQRVSDDIDLHNALVNGATWNQSGNWLTNVGPANPGQRTFTAQDVSQTSDKELKALRERMSSLQLWEGAEPNRIKITPERIYSLGFHPTEDKALVFAGDKMGNIGLFDASQTTPQKVKEEAADDADEDGDVDEEIEPAITSFKIHTRTISAFQFAPHDANALYSCSYDSSIRKLDLEKGKLRGTIRSTSAPSPRQLSRRRCCGCPQVETGILSGWGCNSLQRDSQQWRLEPIYRPSNAPPFTPIQPI